MSNLTTIKEKIFGKHLQAIAEAAGEEFVEKLFMWIRPCNDYETYTVIDTFVQQEAGMLMVLVERHSWGGSGGIDWGFEVFAICGDEKAVLNFGNVRTRFNSEDDAKELMYHEIAEGSFDLESRQFTFQGKNDVHKTWIMPAGTYQSVWNRGRYRSNDCTQRPLTWE